MNNKKTLCKKLEDTYILLEKLPLGISFYETYYDYRVLAEEINNLLSIELLSTDDNDELSIDEFMYDTLYGFIHFKIIPIFSTMEKLKNVLFDKLPADEKVFVNLKYHFGKLSKMQDDVRYEYWLLKTQDVLEDFLNNIKTTKKGNRLFLDTKIMNAIHEIDALMVNIKTKELQNKSTIDLMYDYDVHRYALQLKDFLKDSAHEPSLSLKHKGEITYMNIYSENESTKEQMMEPIYIFQHKLQLHTEVVDNVISYSNMTLKFQSKTIIISKKDGSDLDSFMKTLFKEKSQTWNYDEIADDWHIDSDEYDENVRKYQSKFYQLSRKINEKIAIVSGISNFLIYSKKSVNINKDYLT